MVEQAFMICFRILVVQVDNEKIMVEMNKKKILGNEI